MIKISIREIRNIVTVIKGSIIDCAEMLWDKDDINSSLVACLVVNRKAIGELYLYLIDIKFGDVKECEAKVLTN